MFFITATGQPSNGLYPHHWIVPNGMCPQHWLVPNCLYDHNCIASTGLCPAIGWSQIVCITTTRQPQMVCIPTTSWSKVVSFTTTGQSQLVTYSQLPLVCTVSPPLAVVGLVDWFHVVSLFQVGCLDLTTGEWRKQVFSNLRRRGGQKHCSLIHHYYFAAFPSVFQTKYVFSMFAMPLSASGVRLFHSKLNFSRLEPPIFWH